MANRYSTSGTLAGVNVTVQFQSTSPPLFVPEYVEVHNLDSTNTYTCTLFDSVYSIPPGRVLKIPGDTPSLILNGTGKYVVLASRDYGELPSLNDSSLAAASVGTTYLADESTLHLDVPTHTFSEKDGGTTNVQCGHGVVTDQGVPGQGWFSLAAGNASDGDTFSLAATGGSGVTYTFKNTPTVSTDVQIGAANTDTITNLIAKIDTLQTDFHTDVGAVIKTDVYVWPDQPRTVTASTAGTNPAWHSTVTGNQPDKTCVTMLQYSVTAADVTRGQIRLGLAVEQTITAAMVQVLHSNAVVPGFNGTVSFSGNSVDVFQSTAGAGTTWADADGIVIHVQYVRA